MNGIKHGHAARSGVSKEWQAWSAMKKRCSGTHRLARKNYLDRGITVCDRWLNSFENFLADMGLRPSPEHSLERINNNAGYSRENCRWATPLEQANNKRNNVKITYGSKTQTPAQWSRELGISEWSIWFRFKKGYSTELVFSKTPLQTLLKGTGIVQAQNKL